MRKFACGLNSLGNLLLSCDSGAKTYAPSDILRHFTYMKFFGLILIYLGEKYCF